MTSMTRDALNAVLIELKAGLLAKIALERLILFGSRARGDDAEGSDVDVLVITNEPLTEEIRNTISDCAWEVGFAHDLVIVPIVYEAFEWNDTPVRASLLAKAVSTEGISI
jgi:UTP:GlnB (protein PII) uridylyltransferase